MFRSARPPGRGVTPPCSPISLARPPSLNRSPLQDLMRFSYPSLVALLAFTTTAAAQVSRNCQLLSRMTRSGSTGYAGIWGYAAPDGREFACVGARNGTWIVETTNPTAPVERGFIAGPTSTWREVHGYGDYLYTVTEAAGGVQIISMVDPSAPVLVRNFTQTGWNNTHSVSVDQTAGKLYCNGTNQGMRIYDLLADPTNPVPVTSWNGTYVHDSFIQNGWAYLSCINAGQMRILNVSNLASIQQLSQTSTPLTFTHNTWVNSTDTIAVTTDERSTGFLQVYDVTNKAVPVALGSFSVTGAGIHNAFIVDDKVCHISWYGAGYRGVDITNPNAPTEIGYYDTANAWGCYPFQPSGVVYISDIPSSGGLFCVKLTCGVPERYGQGTAGAAGVPKIDWDGGYARVANATFKVECEDANANAAAVLLIGAAQANIPVLGINLLVDVSMPYLLLNTATSSTGFVSVPVGIPNVPGLGNASLYAQWVVQDAGAPAGFAASRGSKITICP